MSDNENILASAVNSTDHITVFDRMAKTRFDSIDLTPILMYMLDIVPVQALPYLASQFDVLGFNGWALCETELERRTLIKRAIELKKYRGTPWSIKEALKSVGFFGVEIQEGSTDAIYDSTYTHDGTIGYGGGNWANFRLSLLDLGESKGFSTESLSIIIEVVNKYKPVRCNLLDIILSATTIDNFESNDDSLIFKGNATQSDAFNVIHKYDGSNVHDGSWLYAGNSSILTIDININEVSDIFPVPNDSDFIINIVYLSGYNLATESGFDIITEDGNEIILE
jgi:hypothetical protein